MGPISLEYEAQMIDSGGFQCEADNSTVGLQKFESYRQHFFYDTIRR